MEIVSTCLRLCENVLCSTSWGRKQKGSSSVCSVEVVFGGGGGGECDMDSVEKKK